VLESVAGITARDIIDDPKIAGLLNKSQLQVLNAPYGASANPARLDIVKRTTAAFNAASIPLLAGTDAGNKGTQYGASLHHELAAMVDAGLSPLAALKAATSAPAVAFKLSDRGRIANGYKADLVLVAGEPDKDIRATHHIVEIWKDGFTVSGLREQKSSWSGRKISRKKSPLVYRQMDVSAGLAKKN